jgi:ABC-type transporter Mla subunit MlaD
MIAAARTARVVATAALLIAVAAAAVLLWPAGGGRYHVTAVFEQAQGIVAGNNVWAGGAIVGEIDEVRLGADGLPRVRMAVDRDYALRAGARADLRLLSNSGELNRIVVLTAGKGPRLRDGATIASRQTDQPVELDAVLGTFAPRMRADVRAVLARLDDSTRGLDEAFDAALHDSAGALSETTALLRATTADGAALRTVVGRGATAATAFARNRDAMGVAVDELEHLFAATAPRAAQLRAAVRALPQGLRGPRRALEELRSTVAPLRRLVDAAAPATPALVPTSRVLDDALGAATPTLALLARTARAAPPQLRALGTLLGRVEPAIRTLTPALTDGLGALDVARVYTPEITAFLANWSGMSASFDASGSAIRILPAGQMPPNEEISPDRWGPGYIPPPFLRTPGSLVNEPWTDFRSSYLSGRAP